MARVTRRPRPVFPLLPSVLPSVLPRSLLTSRRRSPLRTTDPCGTLCFPIAPTLGRLRPLHSPHACGTLRAGVGQEKHKKKHHKALPAPPPPPPPGGPHHSADDAALAALGMGPPGAMGGDDAAFAALGQLRWLQSVCNRGDRTWALPCAEQCWWRRGCVQIPLPPSLPPSVRRPFLLASFSLSLSRSLLLGFRPRRGRRRRGIAQLGAGAGAVSVR